MAPLTVLSVGMLDLGFRRARGSPSPPLAFRLVSHFHINWSFHFRQGACGLVAVIKHPLCTEEVESRKVRGWLLLGLIPNHFLNPWCLVNKHN